jgi:transcriptional regulator with XRE-family HTH domain
MIKLGKTARFVREKHKISQKCAAEMLGISAVHLCNVENNNAFPSPALLEKYRQLWGVDLYVMAWCLFGDTKNMPPGLRHAAEVLAEAWMKDLQESVDSDLGGQSHVEAGATRSSCN